MTNNTKNSINEWITDNFKHIKEVNPIKEEKARLKRLIKVKGIPKEIKTNKSIRE